MNDGGKITTMSSKAGFDLVYQQQDTKVPKVRKILALLLCGIELYTSGSGNVLAKISPTYILKSTLTGLFKYLYFCCPNRLTFALI